MPLRLDVNVMVHLGRLDIHVTGLPDNAKVLEAINDLGKATTTMNAKLQAALDELISITADERTKLDSITAFIRGVPGLVAAAVTQALADANVADDTAAGLIHDAAHTAGDAVDAALAAIPANTAPGDTGGDTAPAGGGEDTLPAGDGTDTVSDTGGSDTVDAGAGNDAVTDGAASDAAGTAEDTPAG